jgi:hypothetical protein
MKMASSFTLKLITTSRYHLWNDALHARALAHQTNDNWNRGTYVRWAVTTAWAVLEMCCREALEEEKIGYRFKEDLNEAISKKGLKEIDWGSGIWQKVLELKETRRKYTHVNISQDELWPEEEIADKAISIVRDASKNIYQLSNVPIPKWLDDDANNGWS